MENKVYLIEVKNRTVVTRAWDVCVGKREEESMVMGTRLQLDRKNNSQCSKAQ
jgi:hypothetical protein